MGKDWEPKTGCGTVWADAVENLKPTLVSPEPSGSEDIAPSHWELEPPFA